MEYLKIQSTGEIETDAFSLIGASSKRNDSTKIGYYGSGLKYSIASMLRNNINFSVFSGLNEVVFSTNKKNFRDDEYSVICVDGKETSLTVTMGGKDWDLPFAPIREIYSNAMDEDENASIESASEILGYEGKTTFFIEMNDKVKHFYDNIYLYFCSGNPHVLHSNDHGSIYPNSNGGLRLFRKGILSYENERENALYWYNSDFFEINESRVINSLYGAKSYIARAWKKCSNKVLIQNLIEGLKGGDKGKFEHSLEWDWFESFSNEWKSVCSDLKFVPSSLVTYLTPEEVGTRIILPSGLLRALHQQFNDLDILGLSSKSGVEFIPSEPSEILLDKVIDSIALLKRTRYKYRLIEPIVRYGKFTDENTLAMADDGEILLSVKLDSYDINAISKIIIEENEHNKSGFGDKTREFQNHLFDLYFDECLQAVYKPESKTV